MDEQSYFNELIKEHGRLINKICYFYATDIDDFKDLRQESLLNIFRGLNKFRADSKISTWIYRITLNSCVSYVRKNKRKSFVSIENHPELITTDSETANITKELYFLINQLDNKIDKALILMWLDDMDYDAIAEVSGLNKATVGSRLHRIKKKLVELSNR